MTVLQTPCQFLKIIYPIDIKTFYFYSSTVPVSHLAGEHDGVSIN